MPVFVSDDTKQEVGSNDVANGRYTEGVGKGNVWGTEGKVREKCSHRTDSYAVVEIIWRFVNSSLWPVMNPNNRISFEIVTSVHSLKAAVQGAKRMLNKIYKKAEA